MHFAGRVFRQLGEGNPLHGLQNTQRGIFRIVAHTKLTTRTFNLKKQLNGMERLMNILARKQKTANLYGQIGLLSKLTGHRVGGGLTEIHPTAGWCPEVAAPNPAVVSQQNCTVFNTDTAAAHPQPISVKLMNLVLICHVRKVGISRTMRFFLISIFCVGVVSGWAQGALIQWENSKHEFGDVVQGTRVEHTFKFTNIGTSPLIITNVEVSCGCTTPKGWPRDPIKPGEKGEIRVAFNSTSKYGLQNKVVTIVSNAGNPDARQLVLTANVVTKAQAQR